MSKLAFTIMHFIWQCWQNYQNRARLQATEKAHMKTPISLLRDCVPWQPETKDLPRFGIPGSDTRTVAMPAGTALGMMHDVSDPRQRHLLFQAAYCLPVCFQ